MFEIDMQAIGVNLLLQHVPTCSICKSKTINFLIIHGLQIVGSIYTLFHRLDPQKMSFL